MEKLGNVGRIRGLEIMQYCGGNAVLLDLCKDFGLLFAVNGICRGLRRGRDAGIYPRSLEELVGASGRITLPRMFQNFVLISK